MGGSVKKGYTIVGGVVREDVKMFLDELVENEEFESRSKAVGYVLTAYMKKSCSKKEFNEFDKIFQD